MLPHSNGVRIFVFNPSDLNISDTFLYDMTRLVGVLENVLPTVIDSTVVEAQGDSYVRIRKAATRIQGFRKMIDPKNYRNYIQLPYQGDMSAGDNLPLVDDTLMNLVNAEPIVTAS